jgi:2-iminobutanoate/2-iminopropanoate deaminase
MQRWSSNYPSQRNRRYARREAELTIQRDNIFPTDLPRRVIGGHVLYAPVVSVVPGRLVLLSGLLARNSAGEIVGKGDMRAQIRQVGENMKVALAAAGASLADLVRTQTFTTDIDEFLRHVDVRMDYFGALPTSTTVEVRRLTHPDFLVEVEAMAVIAN